MEFIAFFHSRNEWKEYTKNLIFTERMIIALFLSVFLYLNTIIGGGGMGVLRLNTICGKHSY